MEKGRLKLLIICEDIGENTRKKLIAKAVSTRTKYRIYGESSELGRAVGKEGRGVIGIVDNNFAQVITKEIDNDNLDR